MGDSDQSARKFFPVWNRRITRKLCQAILMLVIGILMLEYGCPWMAVRTVWSAEARSPDGLWIARALTEETNGPGIAQVGTSVFLKRAGFLHYFRHSILVLGLSEDENQNVPLDTINLRMTWKTPSHLDVTYEGPATVNFELAHCSGVEISMRDLSRRMVGENSRLY
jgi:hypothetical protein